MLTRSEADGLIAQINALVSEPSPEFVCGKCGKRMVAIPADVGESAEACPVCDAAVIAARKARAVSAPK